MDIHAPESTETTRTPTGHIMTSNLVTPQDTTRVYHDSPLFAPSASESCALSFLDVESDLLPVSVGVGSAVEYFADVVLAVRLDDENPLKRSRTTISPLFTRQRYLRRLLRTLIR